MKKLISYVLSRLIRYVHNSTWLYYRPIYSILYRNSFDLTRLKSLSTKRQIYAIEYIIPPHHQYIIS